MKVKWIAESDFPLVPREKFMMCSMLLLRGLKRENGIKLIQIWMKLIMFQPAILK